MSESTLDERTNMNINSFRVACCTALLGLGACALPRYYDIRYTPVEIPIAAEAVAGSKLRVLATVIGIARADADTDHPAQVEVRMRLENLGFVEGRLLTDGLSLVTADLVAFEPGRIASGGEVIVPAGEARTVEIVFDDAGGHRIDEIDLDGLNLRFFVMFADSKMVAGATFSRVRFVPVNEPRFRVGVGFGTGAYWD